MRMVIVSNRLPITLEKTESGWTMHPGSGGLVTALASVLRRQGGLWIGWPGAENVDAPQLQQLVSSFERQENYDLIPVPLTSQERQGFYHGFANEIIWPLFHDLQSRCNFVPEYWTVYSAVTQRFADIVASNIRPDDFIWVQDYHLIGLGRNLRDRGIGNASGFFLHIPFPPPDIFCKLPWRKDVLESLTCYDVVGFQTPHDLENFSDCLRKLLPATRQRRAGKMLHISREGRSCKFGAFPIGIDYGEFASAAATPEVAQRTRHLREHLEGRQVLLGVDRLDYTKGVPFRLKAFRLALQRCPELHRAITLLQVIVPSREDVPEYQDLKAEIDRLVTQINGEFTQPGWVPIQHVFRSIERDELLAYYRLADVALVTSLKDGMNLVAKEYCACQVDCNGVLVLSEFAGAAVQLGRHAVCVNPYDLDTVADAIVRAVRMTKEERRPAMRQLRKIVYRQDVHWWLDECLKACGIKFRGHAPPTVQGPEEAEPKKTCSDRARSEGPGPASALLDLDAAK